MKIKWECIYSEHNVINYKENAKETWEAAYRNGFLVRHVTYDIDKGDESNCMETMVFVKL